MRGLAALRLVRVIAFLLACGTTAATAQTHEASAPPAAADELSGGAKPEHFLFFGGFDIWHFGYAGYAGAQWAPKALNNDGFVLSVFMSDGVERYDSATARYRTTIFRAAILPGWRFKRGNLEVKVFAGADFERDDFSPATFPARSYANHFGARAAADLWWEPTPTTMLSSSVSVTSIAAGYTARAAAGWRNFGAFWIGPEVSVSADRFSKQYRVGAHITGLKTAAFEWSLAVGYVQDSFQRDGVYGRIGVLTRR